jgi:hypothetical protein
MKGKPEEGKEYMYINGDYDQVLSYAGESGDTLLFFDESDKPTGLTLKEFNDKCHQMVSDEA